MLLEYMPEPVALATALFTVLLTVALLLHRLDRLPRRRPRRNPSLADNTALRRRHCAPTYASEAVRTLVLPLNCELLPATATSQPSIDCSALPATSTPVLVFVNRGSGGQQGEQLLLDFAQHLSPLQVWDLSDGGPIPALQLFRDVPRLRILACGGDGTIGWVGQAIRDAELTDGALLCPVALGTGNDFSRALGWGGGFETPLNSSSAAAVGNLLAHIAAGYESFVDRWSMSQVEQPRTAAVSILPRRRSTPSW
jgi:hypothetical protein